MVHTYAWCGAFRPASRSTLSYRTILCQTSASSTLRLTDTWIVERITAFFSKLRFIPCYEIYHY